MDIPEKNSLESELLDKIEALEKDAATMAKAADNAISLIEQLERDNYANKALVDGYLESYSRVINEPCPKDEVHCGCVPYLRTRIAEFEKQVADLCPIADFPALITWQSEKQMFMENIAELEAKEWELETNLQARKVAEDMFTRRIAELEAALKDAGLALLNGRGRIVTTRIGTEL